MFLFPENKYMVSSNIRQKLYDIFTRVPGSYIPKKNIPKQVEY